MCDNEVLSSTYRYNTLLRELPRHWHVPNGGSPLGSSAAQTMTPVEESRPGASKRRPLSTILARSGSLWLALAGLACSGWLWLLGWLWLAPAFNANVQACQPATLFEGVSVTTVIFAQVREGKGVAEHTFGNAITRDSALQLAHHEITPYHIQ